MLCSVLLFVFFASRSHGYSGKQNAEILMPLLNDDIEVAKQRLLKIDDGGGQPHGGVFDVFLERDSDSIPYCSVFDTKAKKDQTSWLANLKKEFTMYNTRHGLSCANILKPFDKENTKLVGKVIDFVKNKDRFIGFQPWRHLLAPDPLLTQEGVWQAREAYRNFYGQLTDAQKPDLYFSSNMKRAFQTAAYAFFEYTTDVKDGFKNMVNCIPFAKEEGHGADNTPSPKVEFIKQVKFEQGGLADNGVEPQDNTIESIFNGVHAKLSAWDVGEEWKANPNAKKVFERVILELIEAQPDKKVLNAGLVAHQKTLQKMMKFFAYGDFVWGNAMTMTSKFRMYHIKPSNVESVAKVDVKLLENKAYFYNVDLKAGENMYICQEEPSLPFLRHKKTDKEWQNRGSIAGFFRHIFSRKEDVKKETLVKDVCFETEDASRKITKPVQLTGEKNKPNPKFQTLPGNGIFNPITQCHGKKEEPMFTVSENCRDLFVARAKRPESVGVFGKGLLKVTAESLFDVKTNEFEDSSADKFDYMEETGIPYFMAKSTDPMDPNAPLECSDTNFKRADMKEGNVVKKKVMSFVSSNINLYNPAPELSNDRYHWTQKDVCDFYEDQEDPRVTFAGIRHSALITEADLVLSQYLNYEQSE